jgi:hypothetical protein
VDAFRIVPALKLLPYGKIIRDGRATTTDKQSCMTGSFKRPFTVDNGRAGPSGDHEQDHEYHISHRAANPEDAVIQAQLM